MRSRCGSSSCARGALSWRADGLADVAGSWLRARQRRPRCRRHGADDVRAAHRGRHHRRCCWAWRRRRCCRPSTTRRRPGGGRRSGHRRPRRRGAVLPRLRADGLAARSGSALGARAQRRSSSPSSTSPTSRPRRSARVPRRPILQTAVILPVGLVLGWLFLRRGMAAAIAGHVTYNGLLLGLALLVGDARPAPERRSPRLAPSTDVPVGSSDDRSRRRPVKRPPLRWHAFGTGRRGNWRASSFGPGRTTGYRAEDAPWTTASIRHGTGTARAGAAAGGAARRAARSPRDRRSCPRRSSSGCSGARARAGRRQQALAADALVRCDGLPGLAAASTAELERLPGVGPARAARLAAALRAGSARRSRTGRAALGHPRAA